MERLSSEKRCRACNLELHGLSLVERGPYRWLNVHQSKKQSKKINIPYPLRGGTWCFSASDEEDTVTIDRLKIMIATSYLSCSGSDN